VRGTKQDPSLSGSSASRTWCVGIDFCTAPEIPRLVVTCYGTRENLLQALVALAAVQTPGWFWAEGALLGIAAEIGVWYLLLPSSRAKPVSSAGQQWGSPPSERGAQTLG